MMPLPITNYYCEELGIVVRKCYKNSLLKEKQLIVRDGYTVLLEDISSFYKNMASVCFHG